MAAAVSAAHLKKSSQRVCYYSRCYFRLPCVIIDLNAAWLSLFPLSRHLADLLRCGDAGLGTARLRTCYRLDLRTAHQFAARAHLQAQILRPLRAAAANSKNLGKKCENWSNNEQMAK